MNCELTFSGRPAVQRSLAVYCLLGIGLSLALGSTAVAQVQVVTLGGGPITPGGSSSGFVNGPTLQLSQFNHPVGVAVDPSGNLFVADRDNGMVRRLDIKGDRSTTFVAGLDRPVDVEVDGATNIYVLNQGNGTIIKFDRLGNQLQTLASGLVNPTAMALDKNTNMFVAEFGGTVKQFRVSGGVVVRHAGVGQLNGIEVASSGQVAFSESQTHAIRLLDPNTGSVTLLAGGNGAGFRDGAGNQAQFNDPQKIAKAPNGTLIVADRLNHRVRLVGVNGTVSTLYGIDSSKWSSNFPGWEEGDAENAESREPVGVGVSPESVLFTTEIFYHIIRQVTAPDLTGGVTGQPGQITVTAPIISPNAGFFPSGQQITVLSPNPDVFYTVDGAEPTTNSLPVTMVGGVGTIQFSEPLRDLTSLRVKAFVGTNASVTVSGLPASINQVGIPRDYSAGVGSSVVIPVVATLRSNETLRTLQFRVELTPNGGAPVISDQLRALNISSNDFVLLPGPGIGQTPASLSVEPYTNGATRGLAISAIGTNANFQVRNFGVVALLAVPIPPNASVNQSYTIQVVQPSGTSDGLQTPVVVGAMEGRTILVRNLSYVVGDSAPGLWYNAGDFGNGNLNNNDVNNAFMAALGVRIPFTFSDAFDAMDAFPPDVAGTVGGDGEIRFLDWQLVLRRSLRLDVNNWSRTRGPGGFRVPVGTTLNSEPFRPAKMFTSGGGGTWFRQALIAAGNVAQAKPGELVSVPVHVKVANGSSLSGLLFNAVISQAAEAPALIEPVQFKPAAGIPSGTSASVTINSIGYGWNLGAFYPALEQSNLLGSLQFRLPVNSRVGDCYTVHFTKADGAPDLNTQYELETLRGCVWVLSSPTVSEQGISDDWKIHFFGDISNPLAQAAVDPDGDAANNWLEYLAGTNPLDNRSHLKLEIPSSVPAKAGVALRWRTVPGKSYVLESSTDLGTASWKVLATDLVGDGGMKEFVDTVGSPQAQFYRIRVKP